MTEKRNRMMTSNEKTNNKHRYLPIHLHLHFYSWKTHTYLSIYVKIIEGFPRLIPCEQK